MPSSGTNKANRREKKLKIVLARDEKQFDSTVKMYQAMKQHQYGGILGRIETIVVESISSIGVRFCLQ